MKRREFLKTGLIFPAGIYLSQSLFAQKSFGQERSPQFFVEIQLTGGWHTSLAMDPWTSVDRLEEKDAFIEYRHDELIKEGNLFLGPAMAPVRKYAQKMNFINGIFISSSDGGHESSDVYQTSGRGDGTAGTFAVEYNLSQDATPLGVLTTGSVYSGQSLVTKTTINDIKSLSSDVDADLPFTNPQSPITKAFMIQKENAAKITQMKSYLGSLGPENPLTDGHYLAAAFKFGLAATASVRFSAGNLDSHTNHPVTHLQGLTENFNKVGEVFSAFEKVEWLDGKSLLDVTTFYVTSEFSRTPALDASKGTNHNPLNNSAIIMGPNFKQNSVFGASRVIPSSESASEKSYLVAQMVDLNTGEILKSKDQAKKRGTLIRPENVIATLADGLGVQRNTFSPISQDVKAITQLIKT